MTELSERISTLRTRAADPSSTENERTIARTIADRLQKRLDAQNKTDPVWDSAGRVRHATPHIPDEIRSTDGLPFDAPWPDAWTGPRKRVDYEAKQSNHDLGRVREIVLGWDCPRCELFVSKAVPLWYIYRLVGANVDPLKAIRGMMDGRHNQLCDACTSTLARSREDG